MSETSFMNHNDKFREVQRSCKLAAGLVEVEDNRFEFVGNTPAKPVKIQIKSTGKVVTVDHDLAIQRIMSGVATLVPPAPAE